MQVFIIGGMTCREIPHLSVAHIHVNRFSVTADADLFYCSNIEAVINMNKTKGLKIDLWCCGDVVTFHSAYS